MRRNIKQTFDVIEVGELRFLFHLKYNKNSTIVHFVVPHGGFEPPTRGFLVR